MVKVLWNHEDLIDHTVPLNKSVLLDAMYESCFVTESTLSGSIIPFWYAVAFPKQHQTFAITWHKIKKEAAEGTRLSFLLHQSFAALHQNTEKQTQVQLVYIGFHLHLLVIWKQQWIS